MKETHMSELKQYNTEGYNPSTGIYASPFVFQGDWDSELAALKYTRREKAVDDANIVQFDEEKGIVDGYLYNAFRSEDGNSHTTEISDFWNEEDPTNFKYTESYYSSPQLAAICNWFKCEKTRIRIFQQQPGHKMEIHTDFDNQRGNELGETLRIFVQLNDMPGGAWYHFKTADSQVSINLNKGQFLIFNPDHTGHGTENLTNIPRNTFMMVVKRNEWIDNLVKQQTVQYVNVKNLSEKKAA